MHSIASEVSEHLLCMDETPPHFETMVETRSCCYFQGSQLILRIKRWGEMEFDFTHARYLHEALALFKEMAVHRIAPDTATRPIRFDRHPTPRGDASLKKRGGLAGFHEPLPFKGNLQKSGDHE